MQNLGDLRVIRRAFEEHVLQQVGHARFAIALVATADEDGHIDGDRWLGMVWKEQYPHAIFKAILRNAFDGAYVGGAVDLDGCIGGFGGIGGVRGRADGHNAGREK